MGRTDAQQVWNTFYMKKGHRKLLKLDEKKMAWFDELCKITIA